MNKRIYLSLAFAAATLLSACGDDSSSSPTSGNPAPASSAAAAPGENLPGDPNAGTNPDQGGSEQTPASSASQADAPGATEGASAPTVSADSVVLKAEPVSSGSAYVCESTPLTLVSGMDISCDGAYIGQYREDTDATPYDPAAAYTDFVSISKVLASVQPGEKVVFLIRHADRYSTAKGGLLTGLGEYQAIEVGKKLASEATPNYFHSEVLRTEQTAHKIAQGRGQAEINHTVLPELNGDWFIKDNDKLNAYGEASTGTYEVIADWAYNGVDADAFYDFETAGKKFVDDVVVGKMAAQGDFSIAVSHDQFIVPLLVYLTNRQIDLKKYENGRWLHFLAGVAFIIKPDGSVKFVPVKGLDAGVQT